MPVLISHSRLDFVHDRCDGTGFKRSLVSCPKYVENCHTNPDSSISHHPLHHQLLVMIDSYVVDTFFLDDGHKDGGIFYFCIIICALPRSTFKLDLVIY